MDKLIDRLISDHSRIDPNIPRLKDAQEFLEMILTFLMPQLGGGGPFKADEAAYRGSFERIKASLEGLLQRSCAKGGDLCEQFLERLEPVYNSLVNDADAIYRGDPAARSVDEVITAYPGFFAIAVHRIAHEFYKLEVPVLPRLISEFAHRATGIDIHPGAKIGRNFCIDHGTGIVIGETTVINDNVKVYQGVTLGALSVEKSLADRKRHPTIENNVVIYANATILGGDTIIGADSIIGGNVWLTSSVPANSVVYHSGDSKVKAGNS